MRVYDVKANSGVVECGWLSVPFLKAAHARYIAKVAPLLRVDDSCDST